MTYIHINDDKIKEFIAENIHDKSNLNTVATDLLNWFDRNVEYSRLNAPFFPLQRSDLDVISMKSGTCGDYSNLIVSVLISLGYEAMYAYVHRDCYGDEQDHICAAVRSNGELILIDATLPYRKWHGFNCRHQEYELLSPTEFEERMKKEEAHWTDVADRFGNRLYAGLLYAPWIHERILRQTDNLLESIFYLLILDKNKASTLYAYYMKYTSERGTIPMMSAITEGKQTFCFSCKPHNSIWDNEQWSESYAKESIPQEFRTKELLEFRRYISEDLPNIEQKCRVESL